MKKILLIFALLLGVVAGAFAQAQPKISVLGFDEKPFDTTAKSERYKIVDGNGNLFSIIKLLSNNPNDDLSAYSFDFGLCESRIRQVDGEVWVYVQRNAMHATIKREGYKTVKYELNTTVQSGKVYEMTLSCEAVTVKHQMVRFNLTPSVANAMILYRNEAANGEEVVFGNTDEGGSVARSLPVGTYTYRIVSDMFHTSDGRIELDANGKIHVENVTLRPNFANVTFKASEGVDIYINEEKKGKGEWTGTLKAGAHRVGTKKKAHSKVFLDVEIVACKDTVIQLPDPTPIVGTLAIVSSPLDAKVFVDGKDYGLTPQHIENLLVGSHSVEIVKDGYGNEVREVEIVEDEVTECSVTLTKGGAATAQVARNNTAATAGNNAPIMYNSDGTRRVIRYKTISGIVIDKNGYPIAGATVQATGGKESATVAEDGSFSFTVPETLESITAKHKGFMTIKHKIRLGKEENMVLRLRKETRWFINAFFLGGLNPECEAVGCGLMFGQTLNNWGWYAKSSMDFYVYDPLPSITAGFTKRLANLLHLYAGLGYIRYEFDDNYYYIHNYEYKEYEQYNSMMLDLGLIIKSHKNFNINVGTSLFTDFFDECFGFTANIGVGVSF